MQIREYSEQDESAVTTLWNDVFGYKEPRNDPKKVIMDKLSHSKELLLVAVADSTPVGTLMVGYDGHRGWLYRLAVLPSLRCRGIGKALVKEAEARLRRCSKINSHFRIPSLGHLRPLLNRKILKISRIFLRFCSIVATKSGLNLGANNVNLFLSNALGIWAARKSICKHTSTTNRPYGFGSLSVT